MAEGAVLLKNAEAGLGAQGLMVLRLGLRLSPDRTGWRREKAGRRSKSGKGDFFPASIRRP